MDGIPQRSAAEALLEHRGFVRALARGLASDNAADLAQDVMLAGLKQPPRAELAWRSWIRSTVRHLASNVFRGRARQSQREQAAARPEALPSTASLVERLELEQRVVAAVLALPETERAVVLLRFYDGQSTSAIAASLGVPADTVRARLRRALARLRAGLDRDCGDRSTWLRGLLPSGGFTGATVMGAKGISALAAAATLVAASWWALPQVFERGRDAVGGEGSRTDVAVADPAISLPAPAPSAEAPAADPTRTALADVAPSRDDPESVPTLPPPGEVAFCFVDSQTRAVVESLRVRFLSDTRFAHYEGAGEASARLTAGAWSARASAPGYEPIEIGSFEVFDGRVTDLRTRELARGDGRIEGRVAALHVADRSIQVELRGEGRARCARCSEAGQAEQGEQAELPSKCCGFDEEVTTLAAGHAESFVFENLAAGTYWLRAFDPGLNLADVVRVDLDRHGRVWIELDVTPPTSLAVELRHADGHSFTGDWESPRSEKPEAIRFEVAIVPVDRLASAKGEATATPSAADVRLTMGTPTLPEPSVEQRMRFHEVQLDEARALEAEAQRMDFLRAVERAHSGQSGQSIPILRDLPILGQLFESDRLDRAREENDSLFPEAVAPELPSVKFVATRERPDRWVLSPLPRAIVDVTVDCARFASMSHRYDLRHGLTGPLVVEMIGKGEECLAEAPENLTMSCASCHADEHRGADAALEERDLVLRRTAELRAIQLDEARAAAGQVLGER